MKHDAFAKTPVVRVTDCCESTDFRVSKRDATGRQIMNDKPPVREDAQREFIEFMTAAYNN